MRYDNFLPVQLLSPHELVVGRYLLCRVQLNYKSIHFKVLVDPANAINYCDSSGVDK